MSRVCFLVVVSWYVILFILIHVMNAFIIFTVDHPLLGITHRLSILLLALAADLSELLLAVLNETVLLGFLGTESHLELVGLLRLDLDFLGTSLHLELMDHLWLGSVNLLLS